MNEITKTIQFYSAHAKELKYGQQQKVKKLLEFDCINYVGNNIFICKPIKGYNQTTYEIKRNAEGFTCDCQGFQTKLKKGEKGNCSHIGALYEQFARMGKKQGETNGND